MIGRIRFNIILSKIFENSEKRLMGLYDSGESGGLPGLRIMMMIENFHRLRKYDNLSMELYVCVKRSRDFLGSCVATSAVIKSKPGLLCRGEFLIAYPTSLGRTRLGNTVMGSGQNREYSKKIWDIFFSKSVKLGI